MTDRALNLIPAILLAVILGVSPGWAEETTMTVGSDGELYTVEAGTHDALFPGWSLAAPESSVLRLEVTHPDGTRDRMLVPGTQTDDVEDSVSLVFDDSSGTLFVLWQTKINVIHSRLNLTSYQEGVWSPVIEIWGSPFGWKTSPQLLVTRDKFVTEGAAGERLDWARTVVHVIWGEEGSYGADILYSPIVLLDGEFVGRSPVYRLADLADFTTEAPIAAVAPTLAEAPSIQAGRNDQTVVIGLTAPETGSLVTLEVEILPGEIAHLAERLRHQIIDIGREVEAPEALADRLRHQIIDIGHAINLHPGVTTYAASVVADGVVSADSSESIDALAERLRHQIIDIGARMTGRGIDRTIAKTGYRVVEFSSDHEIETGTVERTPNLFRISTTSSRPAPSIPETAEAVSVHLSRSGENVIVSWPEADRLVYLESLGEGWSDRLGISIGPDGVPSVERARQILRRRAESRHETVE